MGGGRRSPIAAFGEFSKIVFIKHLDEKNPERENGKPYAFQRRDGETAEALSRRIRNLYEDEKEREPDVFTESIEVDPPVLAQCVEHLEGISLDRTELDTRESLSKSSWAASSRATLGNTSRPAS